MIALVRGVIARSSCAASIVNVRGSMSTRTGRRAGVEDGGYRRHEREGDRDDLVAGADPGCEQREMQRARPDVDGDRRALAPEYAANSRSNAATCSPSTKTSFRRRPRA